MPDRPDDAHDVHPGRVASGRLLGDIAALVSYMDLHIGRYEIKQLTTTQKELWADLVDADCVLTAIADDAQDADDPRRTPRWWREDYAGPTSPEDPRWHDHGYREPDPFAGRGPVTITSDDLSSAAMDLARGCVLGRTDIFRFEDHIAVYEWAKANARPAPEFGPGMLRWPSLAAAREFLVGFQAARDAALAARTD